MNKNSIITRLLKADMITLEEAIILYNDHPHLYAPYVQGPYIYEPYVVACSTSTVDSDSFKPYDPEEYKEKH